MYLHLQPEELKATPLVNDVTSIIQFPYGKIPPVDHVSLWSYFKKSPEVVALTSCIVEDILSDGWWLEGGRNNIKKAEEFLRRNNAKNLLTSFLYDTLVTGDGYIYKVKPSELEIKSVIGHLMGSLHSEELKSMTADSIFDELKAELASEEFNNIYQTREIRYLPSSVTKIHYDTHGKVTKYTQKVGREIADFMPDEVLHFGFTYINGEMYGFTPLGTCFTELDILLNIKDFERNLFEKGGVPPFIFAFENETPDSPTMKLFKKQLLTYATMSMKWKSLVLTGKVDVKELNNIKDMQFPELSRFATQVLVMAWGVPSARLSDFLVSKGVKGAQTSTEGYYRKISHYQDLLEDMLNSQLLHEFGVILHFNKTYKQDEVREVQIEMFNVDALTKKQQLLSPFNLRINKETLIRELNLKETEVEEGLGVSMVQNQRQGELNNSTLMSQSEDKLADNKIKQSANLEAKSVTIEMDWMFFIESVRHSDVPEVYLEETETSYIFYHPKMRDNLMYLVSSKIDKPKNDTERLNIFSLFGSKQIIKTKGIING